MSKTSCVKRQDGDTFIMVRLSYLRICSGNATAAALISHFEFWHNIKLGARANYIDESPVKNTFKLPSLLQFHSTKGLEDALMGIGKKHSIQKAREMLVELGIVSIHRNPNPNYFFDNTLHYLFHPERVNELLDQLPVNPAPAENIQHGDPKTSTPLDDFSRTIPVDTSIESNEEGVSAQSRGADKKVAKKPEQPSEKKEARPPRPFWQLFVDTWHDFYVGKCNGEAPTIAGKNLSDIGKLYDLLQLRAHKRKTEWTQAYVVGVLTFFLEAAWSDDWLSKHFLLKNLVEQFDAIFAREAEKKKGAGAKRPVDLQYVVDRYFDGELDDRILTPDIYKKLEAAKLVPEDHWGKFVAGKNLTPSEGMTLAIKDWLSKQQKPTT